MKNIHILILVLLFFSCTKSKYTYIGQEIINGKVSAVKNKIIRNCRGCISEPPVIWVQNTKNTQAINLPYELDDKWKVGDSCLLIIEKYKENEK